MRLVFRPVQSHRDVCCRKDLVTSWDVTRDLCPGPAHVCTPPWESPGTHGGAVGDGLTAGNRELRKGVVGLQFIFLRKSRQECRQLVT